MPDPTKTPPEVAREWLSLVYEGRCNEAAAIVATYSFEQLDTLLAGTESYLVGTPFERIANQAMLLLVGLPVVSAEQLDDLAQSLLDSHPLFTEAATAVLTHPLASEETARHMYVWSKKSASLILACGWYYPIAEQLSLGISPRKGLRRQHALALTDQLRNQLQSVNAQVVNVVRSLGLTWTGTSDDLLATAYAITA